MREGRMEGEMRGRQEGSREGRREGEMRGGNEGDRAGMDAGKSAGLQTDQTYATEKGASEGQTAGIANGQKNGQSRCYDEGYMPAYEASYKEAEKLGLADTASYSKGHEEGKANAATIEEKKGRKAGYQKGFALREDEIVNSFPAAMQNSLSKGIKSIMKDTAGVKLPIKMARGGYSTPEERRAYEQAFERAREESFREAYRHAHERAYRDEYRHSYDEAYRASYQTGYQKGFSEGKETAYRDAYNTAYNTQYNNFYYEYSRREYAESRIRGQQDGAANGQTNGFKDGCQANYDAAYKKGYEEVAAVVYPAAFQEGKLAGIAAAEKYYGENAVLKVGDVILADENGNGKFEAGENIIMKVNVRNLGFKNSDKINLAISSVKQEIVMSPNLGIGPVGQRADAPVELKLGTILDTVAPDQDTITIELTENGAREVLSRQEKSFVRSNTATVGIVTEDRAPVRDRAFLVFSSKIAKLNKGEKVIILDTGAAFYKVKKSMFSSGNWNKGYMVFSDLAIQ